MMRALLPWLGFAGFAWLLASLPDASIAQVYRCTAGDGSVAYQDHACDRGQQQKLMDVPSHAPPGHVPPPPASTTPAETVQPPPPAATYMPPPAPLPLLYACVGAVNGKRYLTEYPPGPYLAPLGVLGYPPQSLAQAYGSGGGAGASAPEVAPRPPVRGPSIGAAMTEVQDVCAPATHAETCGYVQRQYDENDHKLRLAMRSEAAPYEQREAALEDQLRNCR